MKAEAVGGAPRKLELERQAKDYFERAEVVKKIYSEIFRGNNRSSNDDDGSVGSRGRLRGGSDTHGMLLLFVTVDLTNKGMFK